MSYAIALSLLLLALAASASQPKPVYKLTPQHNSYEIGVTCTNGGDPTVVGNFDGMLMVSCGKDGAR